MNRFRARFTTRSFMIAVALVGLNLGGGIVTAKLHHGWANRCRGWSWLRWNEGSRTWEDILVKEGACLKDCLLEPEKANYIFNYNNEMIEIGRGYGTPQKAIRRIVFGHPPATMFQIWSPLISSVLLTILVLVVPRGHPGRQRRVIDPAGDSLSPVQPRRSRLVARRLSAVLLLVGLNVMAALYRRVPDPYDDRLETLLRSTADVFVKADGGIEPRPWGSFLVIKPDGYHGGVVFGGRREITLDGTVFSYDDHGVRVRYVDDRSRALGTILYKPDGSIVGYEGKPGEMRAPPHVIRPPLRSSLEMSWPVMASASITLLVLCILWRQVWGKRADPVMQNECDAEHLPHQ